MKTSIHPKTELITVKCACGNKFETHSTQDEIHVEICSACHPFYTGSQKIIDAEGRVERFKKRYQKKTQ